MSKIELLAKIELLNKYEAMMEEIKAEADTIRNTIKAEMEAREVEELIAGQYIVRYKEKDITSQKAKVFDMYGGTAYDVRIRFRNELADAVIDQFGKDIQMFAVDAEHFTITAPIEVSPTFFAWIATFGRRVKILSPEPVVAKMQEFLQKSLEMYKNDGEM